MAAGELRVGEKLRFLLSPVTVFAAIIIGCYVGLFQRKLVPYIGPVGEIYLNLLKLSVLPIMLSAVTISLGRLMGSGMKGRYLLRVVSFFMAVLLLASIFGTLTGLATSPGRNLDNKTLSSMGVIVNESGGTSEVEIALNVPDSAPQKESHLKKFFLDFFPSNIFNALSTDSTLKVLCFSVLFGITLAFVKDEKAQMLFSILEGVFKAFQHMVHLMMYALPFGLVGLLASQLSHMSAGVLFVMLKFIIMFIATCAVAFLLCLALLWRMQASANGLSFAGAVRAIKDPLLIAFSTSNALASLPSTLEAFINKFKVNEKSAELVVPLGIILCRPGTVLFYAAGSIFAAQVYQVRLGAEEMIIILVGSIIASFAASGASGIMAISMFGIIFTPLKLPLEAVMALFIVIDPIMSPPRVALNVAGVCAVSMAITSEEKAPSSDCEGTRQEVCP